MNKIRMIQSEEKSHFKLSQIEERSRKASRHETISDKTEKISTRPRPRLRHEISNFGLETETMSRDLTFLEVRREILVYSITTATCFNGKESDSSA